MKHPETNCTHCIHNSLSHTAVPWRRSPGLPPSCLSSAPHFFHRSDVRDAILSHLNFLSTSCTNIEQPPLSPRSTASLRAPKYISFRHLSRGTSKIGFKTRSQIFLGFSPFSTACQTPFYDWCTPIGSKNSDEWQCRDEKTNVRLFLCVCTGIPEENSKRGITETPFTGCKCHSLIFQTALSTTSTLPSVQCKIMDSLYPAPQLPMSSTMPIPTAPPPSVFSMPQPGMPIVSQGGWSPPSTTCPPGLEYLMGLSHLFVQQKVELIEAFTGFETKNKYIVSNIRGEPVYYVAEQSGFCGRLCLGTYRSCEFHVFDNNRREVLRMVRPFRCESCCCPCCLQELEVYSGDTLLGFVTQDWTIWRPRFSIRNAAGDTVLIIKGPWLRFCIDVTFKIKSVDGKHRVGEIMKEWSGVGKEVFTTADNFGIGFPVDLDVKIKAVLLGACLLFDFMYFEKKDKSGA